MASLLSVGLTIPLPWLWFLLATIFGIIEAMTLGIVSIWFAIGALAAMLTSIFIDSVMIQIFIFLATSLILIVKTRKFAVGMLKVGKEKTNLDDLIGKEAVVTKEILPYVAGEVKLEGKFWRSMSESKQTYAEGAIVTVLRIEVVTIIVK